MRMADAILTYSNYETAALNRDEPSRIHT